MNKYIMVIAAILLGVGGYATYRNGYEVGYDRAVAEKNKLIVELSKQVERTNHEADAFAYGSDMHVVDGELAKLFGEQDLVSACARLCACTLRPEGGYNFPEVEEVDTGLLSEARNITPFK